MARQDWVYSHWQLLHEASPEVTCLVDSVLTAQENWASVGVQTRAAFVRMKNREFSKYALPAEVFDRTKIIYDDLIRVQSALSFALIHQNRVDEFCELLPEQGPSNGTKYVYRNRTLWSSLRTLTREQWTTLIDRAIARDEMVLGALTQSDSAIPDITNNRFISVEVRREVWRRDQGKCVNCGSQQRLEFDHMIPVTMGGASTARNVQLLCEGCNRTKGATLG